MNLGRIGHYFTPRNSGDGEIEGACQTAIVTYVESDTEVTEVNLAVWRKDGVSLGARENVLVASPTDGNASFHLTADCPWHR